MSDLEWGQREPGKHRLMSSDGRTVVARIDRTEDTADGYRVFFEIVRDATPDDMAQWHRFLEDEAAASLGSAQQDTKEET